MSEATKARVESLEDVLERAIGALQMDGGALASHGLKPVVVGVIGPIMPEIMRHLEWDCRIVGVGWEAVDEWRPPAPPTEGKTG